MADCRNRKKWEQGKPDWLTVKIVDKRERKKSIVAMNLQEEDNEHNDGEKNFFEKRRSGSREMNE